jgi:hypothetical protein
MRARVAAVGWWLRLRRRAIVGVVIALSLSPAVAAADESNEPAPGIAVRIGSVRPGTSVAIESTRDAEGPAGRVVTRCFEDCEEILDPGPYRLRLIGSDGETIGTKSVSIRRPEIFHVVDGSPGAANTGLVLGITGAAIAVTGVAAFGSLALDSMCANGCGGSPPWVGVYALVAIPVGVIMTTIGWSLFAQNRRLFRSETIKERRKGHDRDDALNLRVGVAPGPHGMTGGLTLSF